MSFSDQNIPLYYISLGNHFFYVLPTFLRNHSLQSIKFEAYFIFVLHQFFFVTLLWFSSLILGVDKSIFKFLFDVKRIIRFNIVRIRFKVVRKRKILLLQMSQICYWLFIVWWGVDTVLSNFSIFLYYERML